MIREAESEELKKLTPDSEAAVRILGLAEAYGKQPFVRFWQITKADHPVGYLSLLDGAAVLALNAAAVRDIAEETAAFLSMQPEIRYVRTSAETARRIAGDNWKLETGTVMTPGEALQTPLKVPERLTPREIYPVLAACFGDEMPPFSPWYVDVSHRMRHGCCRIAGFREHDGPAACAMTTSECAGAAIIGAVATLPSCRGKGYASASVLTLARTLMSEGRIVYLSPKNEAAHRLYAHIGFTDCGHWGTLSRIEQS